ncbi:MAG TPA: cytochrome c biogenesis protein CcdA [Nitrospirales bacterium]|nr:cytochrome C biogenesis protein [Nitrospiraceae bacterium]HNP31522.1 cytochrome c biogenesis protein CcdA [Nitrospirales bacterium]
MLESATHISQITLLAAFGAGLLSFVSPCVLPLVPSYVSYITGLSIDHLRDTSGRHRIRKTILFNSLLFIGGFSVVFIAFGLSASLVGQWLINYQDHLRKIGGGLIVLFGLYVLGLFNFSVLSQERRFHFQSRPIGYLGSFLIGVTFAVGWTPCVGPILTSILLYASTTDTSVDGLTLLVFYSLGLGLPLLVAALWLDRYFTHFKKIRNYIKPLSIMSGLLLVAVGGLLYTNSFFLLTSYLERSGIGWYIGQ